MKPFWIWRSHAVKSYHFETQSVTPIVQSIGLRWPGGGWLWQFPVAVEVEAHADGTQQRLPIPDPTRAVVWFLGTLALVFLVLAGLTLTRKERAKRQRKLDSNRRTGSPSGGVATND